MGTRVLNGRQVTGCEPDGGESLIRSLRPLGAVVVPFHLLSPAAGSPAQAGSEGPFDHRWLALRYGRDRALHGDWDAPPAPERLIIVRVSHGDAAFRADPRRLAEHVARTLEAWAAPGYPTHNLLDDPFAMIAATDGANVTTGLDGAATGEGALDRLVRWESAFWDALDGAVPGRRCRACGPNLVPGRDWRPAEPDGAYEHPGVRELCRRYLDGGGVLGLRVAARSALDMAAIRAGETDLTGQWLRPFRPARAPSFVDEHRHADATGDGARDPGGVLARFPGAAFAVIDARPDRPADPRGVSDAIADLRALMFRASGTGRCVAVCPAIDISASIDVLGGLTARPTLGMTVAAALEGLPDVPGADLPPEVRPTLGMTVAAALEGLPDVPGADLPTEVRPTLGMTVAAALEGLPDVPGADLPTEDRPTVDDAFAAGTVEVPAASIVLASAPARSADGGGGSAAPEGNGHIPSGVDATAGVVGGIRNGAIAAGDAGVPTAATAVECVGGPQTDFAERTDLAAAAAPWIGGEVASAAASTNRATSKPTARAGLSWPVGPNMVAREGPGVPTGWYLTVRFDEDYQVNGRLAVHPGLDISGTGGGDSDLGAPVYAVGDGIVAASGAWSVWGNVVMIKHRRPDGTDLWSQYAHLHERHVAVGESVTGGQLVGTIGKGEGGRYVAHLHFELRRRDLAPEYWPGADHAIVRAYYVDPLSLLGRADGSDAAPRDSAPLPELTVALQAWADAAQVVRPNEGAALYRLMRSHGYFPLSDEADVAGHRAQLARRIQGDSERIYYAPIGRWDAVTWLARR